MWIQQMESHVNKLPFKIRTWKTKLSLKSMVSGLCSVLITGWEDLGIQGWAPLSELQGQGRAGFHRHREALFAFLPVIQCCGVTSVLKPVIIADIRPQRQRFKLQSLTKCGSFIFTFIFLVSIPHASFSSPLCMCTEHGLFPCCHVSLVQMCN